jgi:hypothetical protein
MVAAEESAKLFYVSVAANDQFDHSVSLKLRVGTNRGYAAKKNKKKNNLDGL